MHCFTWQRQLYARQIASELEGKIAEVFRMRGWPLDAKYIQEHCSTRRVPSGNVGGVSTVFVELNLYEHDGVPFLKQSIETRTTGVIHQLEILGKEEISPLSSVSRV